MIECECICFIDKIVDPLFNQAILPFSLGCDIHFFPCKYLTPLKKRWFLETSRKNMFHVNQKRTCMLINLM